MRFESPSDNIRLAENLEECYSRKDIFEKKMKKDKNGWILLNLHSKFNQVIRLLKNLANFQEEVVQMAQHFLTATGQQSLKNCPQKTLVYLCQSDKLMTYLGFGRLEEIAVLYKDMILNYLQENQDFKKMFSKLTKNLQSNDIF